MQRHLKPTPPAPVVLSVEEEAILIDEQNQNEFQLENGINDAERLGDIIVTMDDVQTVVSNTPELGQVEQDLITSVGDMAVAGTDTDPSDLFPVTVNAGVSTESVVDTIKDKLSKVWEAIKKAVAKMWEHIKSFFGKFKFSISKSEKKAEQVKAGVEKTQEAERVHNGKAPPAASAPSNTFKFKGKVPFISFSGRVPKTGIEQHLTKLYDATDNIMIGSLRVLEQIIDLMDKTVSGITVKSTFSDYEAFQKDFVELVEELGKSVGAMENEGDKVAFHTEVMFGQTALSMMLPANFANKSASINDRYTAARLASGGLSLPGNHVSEVEVPILSNEETLRIADQALKWCKNLPQHKAYDLTYLHNKTNTVEKKVDAARARFASNGGSFQAYTFLNGFAQAFPFVDKMSVKLLGKLMEHVLLVNQEVLEYCDQSNKAKLA